MLSVVPDFETKHQSSGKVLLFGACEDDDWDFSHSIHAYQSFYVCSSVVVWSIPCSCSRASSGHNLLVGGTRPECSIEDELADTVLRTGMFEPTPFNGFSSNQSCIHLLRQILLLRVGLLRLVAFHRSLQHVMCVMSAL